MTLQPDSNPRSGSGPQSDGAAPPGVASALMETHAGQTYGNYILDRLVGQGGMGSVYVATHRVIGTRAAVKLLVKNAKDTRYRDRFFREARQAFELIHPNIVRVLDAGFSEAEGGTCYLAMEYIEGKTLRAHLYNRSFTPAEAMPVFLSLMDALATAHEAGVVHRDVKPDNIIVDKTGRPMLTDFGIARGVEDATEITNAGEILGTPPYMPLEQWDSGAVDARIDQYALGVVFYEMLTQKLPIETDKPSGFVIALVKNKRVPIRTRQPDVPTYLEALIERMMAIKPDDRFPNLRAAYEFLVENAPRGQIRPGTARLPRLDAPADGVMVHTSVTPENTSDDPAVATMEAAGADPLEPTMPMPAPAHRPGSGLSPAAGDRGSKSEPQAVRAKPISTRRPSPRLSHAKRTSSVVRDGVRDGVRRSSEASAVSARCDEASRNRRIVITLCCLIVAAGAATVLILSNIAGSNAQATGQNNQPTVRVTSNSNDNDDGATRDPANNGDPGASAGDRVLDAEFAGGALPDNPPTVVMPAGAYAITRTIVVPMGVTLRIEADAGLAFAADAGVHCEGSLHIDGKAAQPVRFTAKDRTKRWRNLTITGPEATAQIAHLELDRGSGERGAFDQNLVFRRDGETDSTHGGGILIGDGAIVTISDSTIRDCRLDSDSTQTGAGLHISGSAAFESTLTMTGCVIQSNRVAGHGGGLAVGARAQVALTSCEFTSNAAVGDPARGGGLRLVGDGALAEVTAIDCVFASNEALSGGNISVEGNASLTLTAATIEQGRAGNAGAGVMVTSRLPGEAVTSSTGQWNAVARITGGAIRSNVSTEFAGGVAAVGKAVVILDGVALTNNQARQGGALLAFGEGELTRDATEPTITAVACEIALNNASSNGGAACVMNEGRATFRDCTLTGNQSQQGAAIWIDSELAQRSAVSIEGGTVSDSVAGLYGAVFVSGSSDLQMLRVTFENNEGEGAGGAFVTVGAANEFATMRATECEFRGNRSPTGAGGFVGAYSTVTLRDCVFTENSGELGAGLTVASLFDDPNGNPSTCAIDGCRFIDNTANDGAGLYVGKHGQVTLTDCTFRGNRATEAGGALLVLAEPQQQSTVTVRGTSFETNRADRGGAIGFGGSTTCDLARCTFQRNRATTAPAILGSGGGLSARLILSANTFERPEPVMPLVELTREIEFDHATLADNGLDATTFVVRD